MWWVEKDSIYLRNKCSYNRACIKSNNGELMVTMFTNRWATIALSDTEGTKPPKQYEEKSENKIKMKK